MNLKAEETAAKSRLPRPLAGLTKSVISGLEGERVPFYCSVLAFVVAVILRHSLEMFSSHSSIPPVQYIHYTFFYLDIAVALILMLHAVTGEKVSLVAKSVLPSFILVAIPPMLDILISGGKGYSMAYMLPLLRPNLPLRLVTFFGPLDEKGFTPGMRIEVFLAMCGAFLYSHHKTRRILRSLLAALLLYLIVFVFGCFPFLVKGVLRLLHYEYVFNPPLAISFYMFFLFLFLVPMAYRLDRRLFVNIMKDIRWMRTLHFELMFLLGLTLGRNEMEVVVTPENMFSFLFVPIAIVFAFQFAVITNNLSDIEIDRISNPKRPLFNPEVDPRAYRLVGWLFLAGALAYAGAADFVSLKAILCFVAGYFVYSMPPIRLKRVPVLSKLIISINSIALIVAGYATAGGQILNLPRAIMIYFLVYFTLAANFIDLKDHEGDKASGIKTLPVLLGLRSSKAVIGAFFCLAYAALFRVFPETWVKGILILAGVAQIALINRRSYYETPVFLVYLASIVGFIGYLYFLAPASFLSHTPWRAVFFGLATE